MSLTMPQRKATPTMSAGAVFPEPLMMLPTDLSWLLDSDQQMDLLQHDLQRTQPTIRIRVKKSRALMRALRTR